MKLGGYMRLIALAGIASGHASQKDLIQTVAFDTNCPQSNIPVLDKNDTFGTGQYRVQACGKELKYKRSGTVFYAADKSPI